MTSPISRRQDTDYASRAANVAWHLQQQRLEREAANRVAAEKLAARLPAILADVDRRFELLEAAVVGLTRALDEQSATR